MTSFRIGTAVSLSAAIVLTCAFFAPDPVAAEPHAMPAHPDLVKAKGRAETARLQKRAITAEARQEMEIGTMDKAASAALGTGSCLVILWEFTDHPADAVSHPNSAYDEMMFSTGVSATGSMNDYYLEVSHGLYGVAGAVVGWTTASNTYASYAETDGSMSSSSTRNMLVDAVAELDAVVDFSLFDNDGPDGVPNSGDDDGLVDALFFVHSGPGQEQSGDPTDIWSHAWVTPGLTSTGDGVYVWRYNTEPEEFVDGSMISVGVFAHEYGHTIGLPDLYDTDYSSNGIGDWGLMSGGSWTHRPGDPLGSSPSHMTAWSKIQMGWLTPTDITSNASGLVALPAETNAQAFRVYPGGVGGGSEYFLLENRRRVGFDEGLTRRQIFYGLTDPEGLIIYHVDESAATNSSDFSRLVDVVDASPWIVDAATWHENLDAPTDNYDKIYGHNRGDNGDLWPGFTAFAADTSEWTGVRDRTTLDGTSIPSSLGNDCSPTGVTIDGIAMAGENVTFDVTLETGGELGAVAAVTTWDFEANDDDWQYCNSTVHYDTSQPGACGGTGGLWFGRDGYGFCGGSGYGNGWNDITWVTVGLVISDAPSIDLTHHYDLEVGYDYAYLEVRAAGQIGAPWTQLAAFNGYSSCTLNSFAVPAPVLTAGDPDGNGISAVQVRLRMTSDGAWSAEDGDFCGIGWWVDAVGVSGNYIAAADLPGARQTAYLDAPSPNPFNPTTVLKYHVPNGARRVALAVFDQRGRQVRELEIEGSAGWHEASWDGRNDVGGRVASGLYFARLRVDDAVEIRKMALVK